MSGAMIRLLLFLLPFLLFLLWLWIARRTRFGREQIDERTAKRITLSGIAAIGLAVAGFVVYGVLNTEEPRSKDYVPPRMIDGKIAPGEFKQPEKRDERNDDGNG